MSAYKKNVIITGAARGIGRVIARQLALLGHNLFLIDIQEDELLYTVESHIPKILSEKPSNTTTPAQDGVVGYKICDLRHPAAISDAVQAAASFLPGGEVDVLINNAGLCKAQFKDDRAMEDPGVFDEWTEYLATNLTAPFLVSQA